MNKITLSAGKKAYFASDFHLGGYGSESREQKICAWLRLIEDDCSHLFLVGDLFDFWFEYAQTIPKGFSRFFGQLAKMADAGVQIYIFKGNHDMWLKDYFKTEFNAIIVSDAWQGQINEHRFFMAHGDGLGPGDYTYKILKKVFRSRINTWLFDYILPSNIGLKLGILWAQHSWKKQSKSVDPNFILKEEKEILISYCKTMDIKKPHDFYIFGHRHRLIDVPIGNAGRYINLGDWIVYNSYGVYDGVTFKMERFVG